MKRRTGHADIDRAATTRMMESCDSQVSNHDIRRTRFRKNECTAWITGCVSRSKQSDTSGIARLATNDHGRIRHYDVSRVKHAIAQHDLVPIYGRINRGLDCRILRARHEQLVRRSSGRDGEAPERQQDRSHGGLLLGPAYPTRSRSRSAKGPPGLDPARSKARRRGVRERGWLPGPGSLGPASPPRRVRFTPGFVPLLAARVAPPSKKILLGGAEPVEP